LCARRDANNKLNSPPAYKINYLLAENKPQPSIPNLTAYNNPTQMPTPPMAPQFYNTYNSFQKTQMNSPPPQFNPIKRRYLWRLLKFINIISKRIQKRLILFNKRLH